MHKFTVYPNKLKSEAAHYETMYKDLKSKAEEVDAVKKHLGSSFSSVSSTLDIVYNNLLEEAVKINNMHKALEMLAQEYISCESRICDLPSDKRSLFQKILGALHLGDERYQDPAYYDTSKEEEEAQDRYLKEQITDILAQPQYSESAWNAADTEERKTMLTNLLNDISAVYGVEVNQTINFTNTPPQNGIINHGSYSHSTQTVSINLYYMENYATDSYSLTETIVHELRHAYQHQAVENPEKFIVTQETLDLWECNFDNYVSSKDGFDLYREQRVETDARDLQEHKP